MTTQSFPYQERSHDVFGTIMRPVITLNFYSIRFARWFVVRNILADTGADVTVVPLPLGRLLIGNVQEGQPIRLGRVVSSAALFHGFVHRVSARIGAMTFEMPVAVAMTATIPPIFGRREALDQFSAHFVKGQELLLDL